MELSTRYNLDVWKHELQFTECGNGTFGQDCSESCGTCLREEQCHHVNGICMNGCDRGFQGNKCTEGKWVRGLNIIYSLYAC